MGAVRPVLGAIQDSFCGGPDSRWAVKESQSLGPLLSPWGSCQHQLSFLGHVPWYLQHQEVSGNSDSGLGLDCLACQGWELLLTLFQVGLGQVILEVSGERDVFRQEAFRCLLSFDLEVQGEGFRLPACGSSRIPPGHQVQCTEGETEAQSKHSKLLLGALSPTTFVPSVAARVMPSKVSLQGTVRLG